MCDIINKLSQKTKSSGLLCTGTGTVFLEYRVGTPVLFFIISGENDTIWLLQFIGTGSGGQKIKNCSLFRPREKYVCKTGEEVWIKFYQILCSFSRENVTLS